MSFLKISIVVTAILFSCQVYSQQTEVIVDDGYNHAEMSVHPWGGSHGLFFGSRVNYSGTGDLWMTGNATYANNAGPYNYGAFSMGYVAHGGIFGFYDGGISTGNGNVITWRPVMTFARGGNIGIGGTYYPSDLLTVDAGATRRGITITSDGNADAFSDLVFRITNSGSIPAGSATHWVVSHRKDGYFSGTPSGQSSLEFFADKVGGGYFALLCLSSNGDIILASTKNATAGNVLIGKTSQTNASYKLDINGAARASKIVVNTTGADFVFEDDYSLRTLEQLHRYIRQNKHLPEIPSAKEMEKEGLDVGELNIKLLQKVEELTLYLIEQNKKLEEQIRKNNDQQREIDTLKKQVQQGKD